MVIYLDVVILEETLINSFLLYITSKTIKIETKIRNILAAGFLSSFYILTLIFPSINFFSSLIFKFLVALLMIIITFRKKSLIFNIKALCILVMYSMMLAGFCIFIEFYIGKELTFDLVMIPFTYKYLVLSVFIIFILIRRLIIFIKDRKELTNYIYKVEIIMDGNITFLDAFLDTGNELREPVTNLPVLIVEKDIFKYIETKDKLYIPYKLANGNLGYFEGFKPSFVNIYLDKKIMKTDLIVALSNTKFSELNDYNALLSRGTL